MRVLIIEDEIPAQQILMKFLGRFFPDFTIVGILDSVDTAVNFLRHQTPDLIFLDVELSDGKSFEIFRQVEITCPIIVTTAYADYALDAFRNKCIDYLLKPVDPEALKRAIDRCIRSVENTDIGKLSRILNPGQEYKHRFIVRMNDKILPVRTDDIAYFYSEEKNTILATADGKKYIMASTLDILSEELDPAKFFRISRSCILNMQAIESLVKHFSGRLKVIARPRPDFEMTVSRSRVEDFMLWLEGKI